jgi:hypothetical protein
MTMDAPAPTESLDSVPDEKPDSAFERDPATGATRLKSNRYQFLDDLDEAKFLSHVASVDAIGFLYPVLEDQHGNVLDGHQRVRAAAHLGISYPREVVAVRDEEHAQEIAQAANLERRHIPPEMQKAIIRDLLQKGWSTRRVQEAVPETSQSTIARESRKMATESPDSVPAEVTGRDNKTRPRSTKPKSETQPKTEAKGSPPKPTSSVPEIVKHARQVESSLMYIESSVLSEILPTLETEQLVEVKAALNKARKVLAKITAAEKRSV